MEASRYIAVGRIVKTHGVAGELSVAPLTSLALDEMIGDDVWIVPPVRLARPHRISSVRTGPKGPLVVLEDVTDIEHAREMVGASLCIPGTEFPDEMLADEPSCLGYAVSDEDRGDLGTVEDTIVTGANDVWVVQGPAGEVLLPVIDDVVLDVDHDTKVVRVKVLPGLVEDDS
jgi:16S rRNA processing protein RimM